MLSYLYFFHFTPIAIKFLSVFLLIWSHFDIVGLFGGPFFNHDAGQFLFIGLSIIYQDVVSTSSPTSTVPVYKLCQKKISNVILIIFTSSSRVSIVKYRVR